MAREVAHLSYLDGKAVEFPNARTNTPSSKTPMNPTPHAGGAFPGVWSSLVRIPLPPGDGEL